MSTATLLWGLLFGSFGMGFFVYGKKQQRLIPLVCGVILMILPYLVANTILLALGGLVLIAVPFLVRI